MNPIRTQHEADQILWRLPVWIALVIAFVMGFYVLPNFRHIFAEMLPAEQLPWLTRIAISAGPAVFGALVVSGPALLVLNDSRRWARWLHNALIIALAVALGFTVVALFAALRLIADVDA